MLNLTGCDLSSVDASLLARVVHGVIKLHLKATKFTTQQIEAVLVALGDETKLKIIIFFEIDLTAVDPELLARAVSCLEGVAFYNKTAKLTSAQSEAIYTTVANEDTKLKNMSVPGGHSVSPDVLARALNKLETCYGTLPGPIAERVLAQSLVQTKLTRAIFTLSKLTKLELDEDLVRAASKVIPHLHVSKVAVYHPPSGHCTLPCCACPKTECIIPTGPVPK